MAFHINCLGDKNEQAFEMSNNGEVYRLMKLSANINGSFRKIGIKLIKIQLWLKIKYIT